MSASYPNDGDWHHIALVYDGANTLQNLYIDGIVVDSNNTSPATFPAHNSDGGIANVHYVDAFSNTPANPTDRYFTGKMDAVAVYNSALSLTDIEMSACYTPPTNGCVTIAKSAFEAFWDFDVANGANDASGNGHDPQVAISSGISFDSSDFKDGDQSIVFNGAEAIRYATNNSNPDTFLNDAANSRSIAVWIKIAVDGLNGVQNIFDEGGNNKGIAVRLSGNTLESVIRDTNTTASIIDATYPNDGVWHHIAIVYDGVAQSHKLFIDGIQVAIESGSGVPSTVPSNLSYGGIGGRLSTKDSFQNTSDAFFTGKMDAFAVSNDAISGEQIKSLITPWYLGVDNDGDSYFGNQVIVNQCTSPGAGYSASALTIDDCDDTPGSGASINPGATEIEGNSVDEDCDGEAQVVLNIDNLEFEGVIISPNPFTNKISIDIPLRFNNSNLKVELFDLNGRIVYNQNTSISDKVVVSDGLTQLSEGVYFIKLTSDKFGSTMVKRVVKY